MGRERTKRPAGRWRCVPGRGWRHGAPTRSQTPHCRHRCCCPEHQSLFHCHLTNCQPPPSYKQGASGPIRQPHHPPLAAPHHSWPPSPLKSWKISSSAVSAEKNLVMSALRLGLLFKADLRFINVFNHLRFFSLKILPKLLLNTLIYNFIFVCFHLKLGKNV